MITKLDVIRMNNESYIENTNNRKSKGVLIIDDKEENKEVVSFFLEAHDIPYKWVNEGKKGLETIRNEGDQFNLILLDLAIPDFSGIDIFDSLVKEDLLKLYNVVIFTASSGFQEQIDRMLSLGAKGIIYKPPSLEVLEKMVELYLI